MARYWIAILATLALISAPAWAGHRSDRFGVSFYDPDSGLSLSLGSNGYGDYLRIGHDGRYYDDRRYRHHRYRHHDRRYYRGHRNGYYRDGYYRQSHRHYRDDRRYRHRHYRDHDRYYGHGHRYHRHDRYCRH